MRKKVSLLAAAAALMTGWAAIPARSQGGCPFQFPPATNLRASGGGYQVRWEDVPPQALDLGVYSLTWYYGSRRDGADRVRLATIFRDDFNGGGFRANWQPQGQFVFDWDLKTETLKDRRIRN